MSTVFKMMEECFEAGDIWIGGFGICFFKEISKAFSIEEGLHNRYDITL